MIFKEIIVVEGIHDHQKLNSIYPDIETIVTGGSSISSETLLFLKEASLTRGIILLLDPDFPGKQITNKILSFCEGGNIKIASLEKSKAISKNGKKVGIEHARKEDIIESLEHVVTLDTKQYIHSITLNDLIERKLVRDPSAKSNRNQISNKLHIPLANGKTFLKYLQMMHISLSKLDEVMK